MRRAVSGLLLAAAFQCLANPVLIGEGDEIVAAPQSEDRPADIVRRTDRQLVESDPLTPPPAPQIHETRGDEAVSGRRPGFDDAGTGRPWAAPGLPGNYGNAFGQGDTLRNQLLRDFDNPSAHPAGAPATGAERARRGGATESDPGGSSPLNPAQAMLREAVENSLRLVRDSVIDEHDMLNFSIVGVDFNLTLSGGRRSLTVNGSDVWPTMLYDPLNEELRQGPSVMARAMQGQGGQSAAGGGGSAQPWASAQSSPNPSEIPRAAGSTDGVPFVVAKVREFVTDPMTIIAVLGCLVFWMGYEIASAVRERRRLRRHRRREARARA